MAYYFVLNLDGSLSNKPDGVYSLYGCLVLPCLLVHVLRAFIPTLLTPLIVAFSFFQAHLHISRHRDRPFRSIVTGESGRS